MLHSSPTSVLVAHRAGPGDAGKVLLGTDGSRGSEFGLRSLAQFADSKRCSVQVTSVSGADRAADAGAGRAALGRERPDPDLFARAERHISHAAVQLEEAGFDVTQKVAVGHLVEQLLQEARRGISISSSWGRVASAPCHRDLPHAVCNQEGRAAGAPHRPACPADAGSQLALFAQFGTSGSSPIDRATWLPVASRARLARARCTCRRAGRGLSSSKLRSRGCERFRRRRSPDAALQIVTEQAAHGHAQACPFAGPRDLAALSASFGAP